MIIDLLDIDFAAGRHRTQCVIKEMRQQLLAKVARGTATRGCAARAGSIKPIVCSNRGKNPPVKVGAKSPAFSA